MEDITDQVYSLHGISVDKLEGIKEYRNCLLYTSNECAKAIIQSGIREVVYDCDKYEGTASVTASKRMLKAAGVTIRRYEPVSYTHLAHHQSSHSRRTQRAHIR